MSSNYADYAESRADRADDVTVRGGEDALARAIGTGLSAVAYALLEVADAIRENTASRR
ncbi:hypothetical protein GA0115233_107641 [Streptomyces sp. DI166]|uniref:hypothetical protein n=1 Tax=Streptomyces sp. DI166 TaxID=1839783 RepID=UPI0007F38DB2|nr:hypothetical protein [Streptomyces sp. DI166]SBT94007.1 hypothetical protein GA0115233_107641 [Streptomyces sp. DI166]